MSDGTDDFLSDEESRTVSWGTPAVVDELMSLSSALQAQQRNLAARAADLSRREEDLAKDEAILRGLLDKEAARLASTAGDKLDAAANAHVQRLESVLAALRQQCEQLRLAKAKQLRAATKQQQAAAAAAAGAKATASAPAARASTPPPPMPPAAPAAPPPDQSARVRELQAQLQQARELSAMLLLSQGEEEGGGGPTLSAARRRALPGAADALIADAGSLGERARCRLLSLLLDHTRAPSAASSDLSLWERRIGRHLSRAAAAGERSPLFGSPASEPLASMLLLRLGVRAHQRGGGGGGGGAAGGGLKDMGDALSCMRRMLGRSEEGSDARGTLIGMHAVAELAEVLRVGAGRPSLAKAAATLLVALCTAPRRAGTHSGPTSAALAPLATPAFVRAAMAVVRNDGASEGAGSTGACVSLLLQRLSLRSSWRYLFEPSEIRKLVREIKASDSGGGGSDAGGGREFVVANLLSIMQNVDAPKAAAAAGGSRPAAAAAEEEAAEPNTQVEREEEEAEAEAVAVAAEVAAEVVAEATVPDVEATPLPERRRRILARVAGVSPSVVEEAQQQEQQVDVTPLPEKQRRILARVAGVTPSRSDVTRAVAGARIRVPTAKRTSEGNKKETALRSRQVNVEATDVVEPSAAALGATERA
jgi:hypothetical protein